MSARPDEDDTSFVDRVFGPARFIGQHTAKMALEPVREIHQPVSDGIGLTVCRGCSHYDRRGNVKGGIIWPCATAKVVYAAAEITTQCPTVRVS